MKSPSNFDYLENAIAESVWKNSDGKTMQNFMDIDQPQMSDNEKQDMDDGSEDGEVVDEGTNFYKSYNELAELDKKKLENVSSDNKDHKQKNEQLDNTSTEVCTDSKNSNINKEQRSNLNKEQNIPKEGNKSGCIAHILRDGMLDGIIESSRLNPWNIKACIDLFNQDG